MTAPCDDAARQAVADSVRRIAERVAASHATVIAASRLASELDATLRPLQDRELTGLIDCLQTRLSARLSKLPRPEGGGA